MKLFATALAEFLVRHKHASLAERICALEEELKWLEIEAEDKTQKAEARAYGKQLLMPRRPR